LQLTLPQDSAYRSEQPHFLTVSRMVAIVTLRTPHHVALAPRPVVVPELETVPARFVSKRLKTLKEPDHRSVGLCVDITFDLEFFKWG
jgi:hypothetical protein